MRTIGSEKTTLPLRYALTIMSIRKKKKYENRLTGIETSTFIDCSFSMCRHILLAL